jgi:hypothetical protein
MTGSLLRTRGWQEDIFMFWWLQSIFPGPWSLHSWSPVADSHWVRAASCLPKSRLRADNLKMRILPHETSFSPATHCDISTHVLINCELSTHDLTHLRAFHSFSLFGWLMAGAGLFWDKSTAGWLLVAGLFWEKSTVGWWLISQANRAIIFWSSFPQQVLIQANRAIIFWSSFPQQVLIHCLAWCPTQACP